MALDLSKLLTEGRLAGIRAKPERLVIGLMSGTSVDGIDAALVRIRGGGAPRRTYRGIGTGGRGAAGRS